MHNDFVLSFQRFKNSSPLSDDTTHTLRQEWATYLFGTMELGIRITLEFYFQNTVEQFS